jgi:phosphoglycerate dehydrogenase-like enzyme
MIKTAMYDAKAYDKEYFGKAEGAQEIRWDFHEFSLNAKTAGTAAGAQAVGIIGTGKIGKITAQIFRGFDAKVLAYDTAPDA